MRPNPSPRALTGADGRARGRRRRLSLKDGKPKRRGSGTLSSIEITRTQYQQGPPGVFERYAMGLQDGHAMMRAAAVDQHVPPPAHRTHV